MQTSYRHISSVDYIEDLRFEFVETYSFQRGSEYESSVKSFFSDYNQLKAKLARRSILSNDEKEQFSRLDGILGRTQYLIGATGKLHFSAIKKSRFPVSDTKSVRLVDILKTPVSDVPNFMCGPIYKDAVVFYDQSGIAISTLNICLSCEYMQTGIYDFVDGDAKTYDLLKGFFTDIGHEVES